MNKFLLLFLVTLNAFAAEKPFKAQALPFVDEAKTNPSFLKFRNELLAVVKAKNEAKLLTMVDPEIKNSFGPDSGIAKLKADLNDKKDPLWTDLEIILTMGGKFTEDEAFEAPYVTANWPNSEADDYDAFDFLAVTKKNTPLRDKPNTKGKVLGKLGLELVKKVETEKAETLPKGWEKVSTSAGKVGYVESSATYSGVGYRAYFEQTDGKWRITTLVAGD